MEKKALAERRVRTAGEPAAAAWVCPLAGITSKSANSTEEGWRLPGPQTSTACAGTFTDPMVTITPNSGWLDAMTRHCCVLSAEVRSSALNSLNRLPLLVAERSRHAEHFEEPCPKTYSPKSWDPIGGLRRL